MNIYFKILLLLLTYADNLVADVMKTEENETSTVSVSTPASEQTTQVTEKASQVPEKATQVTEEAAQVTKEATQVTEKTTQGTEERSFTDSHLKDVDVEKRGGDEKEQINLRKNIQTGLDQVVTLDKISTDALDEVTPETVHKFSPEMLHKFSRNALDKFSPDEADERDPLAGTDPRLETKSTNEANPETKVTEAIDLTSGFATEATATTQPSTRCVQVDRRSFEYRKALDGGFVEFVQAERLPVYPEELNICPHGFMNHTETPTTPRSTSPMSAPLETTQAEPSINARAETPAEAVVDTATKATVDGKVTEEGKPAADIRRSDYLFSSLEYYDEVINFDVSVCSADVEEIILEQDSIRPYDVECSQMLEWRSLEGYT